MTQDQVLLGTVAAAGAALLFAVWRILWINAQDTGTDRLREIGGYIREGAMAFLRAEFRALALFVAAVALVLVWANTGESAVTGFRSPMAALAFVTGAGLSALAGWIGMHTATGANVRTAAAARKGLNPALAVAFSGGTVMGMVVVGLALGGLAVLLLLFTKTGIMGGPEADLFHNAVVVCSSFSLGASSIALFARVGGGIYTKAADVGADLVGKVEAGIPEDDPRNPAVIADNVGDNVGDVAGMGADLFESFVGAIIATMVLGAAFASGQIEAMLLPLLLAGVGIIASILGTFMVRTSEGGNPQTALNMGTLSASVLMALGLYWGAHALAPELGWIDMAGRAITPMQLVYAALAGLLAGVAVGFTTEYYCATDKAPVHSIAKASETGPATTVIAGLAVGYKSVALPILWICGAILVANYFGGLYGVALAAVGMLSTTGIQLAVDAYGPIADNAGGLTQMAGLPKEVRQRTDKLDAVGNTTAAIGKGFAIGSAALTGLALFVAYQQQARVASIDLSKADVIVGLLIGAALPYLFSSMAISAVGEAAGDMVREVRRQFKEIPGLLKGKKGVKADHARCIEISTKAALRRMILPGMLGVVAPVIVGLIDKEALGGMLAGVMASAVILAIFQSNAGGAWDNAKKYIESGAHGGKGSPAHKAAVVGDTVGDPLKDTSGPSLNILLKLVSVVALVMAPFL
jgi:K(+)-stimulated pyrophosphate-energized sodium pump